ncbi:hypothetical protein [Halostagnicola sp. A-GB9-2]|uniref:hypothetical protein n=1 Tax=Halostagnicola sp. A-GB9-2 TaxID=3048066 RepID=UPI0024BF537E|nr:hypothetical protein [Halostagnicola sp. A-GB9-2]MDJ1432430.1 hypothetical protein [Halostagnicola sp. A-GB9-2]
MYDDDSRGLESPDRPHAPTTNAGTRALRTDGGSTHPSAFDRLELIDRQAEILLEQLEGDQPDTPTNEATRHVREIRAEAEWAHRLLREPGSETGEESTAGDSEMDDESATNDDDSSDSTADDVPMLVERGGGVTSVLGPDPVAYDRWRRENENPERADDSRRADDTDSNEPDSGRETTSEDESSADSHGEPADDNHGDETDQQRGGRDD